MAGQSPINIPSFEEALEALNKTSDTTRVVDELISVRISMTIALAAVEEQIGQTQRPLDPWGLEERRQQEQRLRDRENELNEEIQEAQELYRRMGRPQERIDLLTEQPRKELAEVEMQLQSLSGTPEDLQSAIDRRNDLLRKLEEFDKLILFTLSYAILQEATYGIKEANKGINDLAVRLETTMFLANLSEIPDRLKGLTDLVTTVKDLQTQLNGGIEGLKAEVGSKVPINFDVVANRLNTPLLRLESVASQLEKSYSKLDERIASATSQEDTESTNVTGIFNMVLELIRSQGLNYGSSDVIILVMSSFVGAFFFAAGLDGQYNWVLGLALSLMVPYPFYAFVRKCINVVRPIKEPTLRAVSPKPATPKQEELVVPLHSTPAGGIQPRPAGGPDKEVPAVDERDVPPFLRKRQQ